MTHHSVEAFLAACDKKLVALMQRHGLATPDLLVEMCETPALLAYRAWQEFPVRYPHWSHGKRQLLWEEQERRGSLFLDMRGVPGNIVWLCASDPPAQQLFSLLYARLRHDFALRNRTFQEAMRKISALDVRVHARRVRRLVEDVGLERVERTLTAAHMVRRQCRNTVAPEGSTLAFLAGPRNDRMPSWQRELCTMVEKEWPLIEADEILTIADLGYAMWWLKQLLHEFGLEVADAVEAARIVASLIAVPDEPMAGFVPHVVGFCMFDELASRKGERSVLRAAEKIADDAELIRTHLTQEAAQHAGLAAAEPLTYDPHDLEVKELPDAQEQFRIIRETLAQQAGHEKYPTVRVEGVSQDGIALFAHTFEGRYLDREVVMYHVLPGLVYLWGAPVRLRFREVRQKGADMIEKRLFFEWCEVDVFYFSVDERKYTRKQLTDFVPFAEPDDPPLYS